MKTEKIIKFNLWASCILLVVFILMFVGTTIAFFSDRKQVTNTFTSGNVKIVLSESAVKDDGSGNLIADIEKPRIFGTADSATNDYGIIHPGQIIYKDPTITNSGNTEEWIAAKVTLYDGAGDLTEIMAYEGYEDLDIEIMLSGGLLDEKVHVHEWNGFSNVCLSDNYAMVQVPNASEGKFEFFFFMLKPVKSGESVVVFDHINIPAYWSGTEMQQLANLRIDIEAFGVQTYQLDSCFQAMAEAFPEHFNFN